MAASTIRTYKCGCIPDLDILCEAADEKACEERYAIEDRALSDWLTDEQEKRLEEIERSARQWLCAHFKEQEEKGEYRESFYDPDSDEDEYRATYEDRTEGY